MSNIIAIALGIVGTFATAAYAGFAWWLASETVRLRKAQTDPEIAIYLEPEQSWLGLIDLVIRNIGHGPAYDVSFAVAGLTTDPRLNLNELTLLKEGIEYMAPGQEFRTFFGSSVELLQEPILRPITIRATFHGKDCSQSTVPFNLDINKFYGMSWIGKPAIEDIAKSVDQISKDIRSLIQKTPEARLGVEIKSTSETARDNLGLKRRYFWKSGKLDDEI